MCEMTLQPIEKITFDNTIIIHASHNVVNKNINTFNIMYTEVK